MSTRFQAQRRAFDDDGRRPSVLAGALARDPAEELALVAGARRELLLRAHRHRLRREDLEDCYSQATLELVVRARQGASYASRAHLANALEQKFLSRIQDRRRALSGRSPMQAALELAIHLDALSDDELQVVDRRAEVEKLVLLREDLRRVGRLAGHLTPDQRLVLSSQLAQVGCTAFCRSYGWSAEKYRKVAQRARARLSELMGGGDVGTPPVPFGKGMSEERTGTAHDEINSNS